MPIVELGGSQELIWLKYYMEVRNSSELRRFFFSGGDALEKRQITLIA